MATIDQQVFNDCFNGATLTNAIIALPFKPMRIAALGLFSESGIYTTDLMIERVRGVLNLVPHTPRGGPARPHARTTRDMVEARTAHFIERDTLYADSIQGRREFGGIGLMAVEAERDRILQGMRDNLDATLEHQRVGALRGLVQDANGNVLIDLFADFEVTQQVIDMGLDSEATKVRTKCIEVSRAVEDELGGLSYKTIHVLCSREFFTALTDHPAVNGAFDLWMSGAFLRNDSRKGFQFGNLTFEEYRGKVGEQSFIPAGEAYAFPTEVPDLFVTKFAPADYLEAANTEGIPFHAKAEMGPMGRSISIEAQNNPISLCTRPRAVVKLTAS